MSSVFLRCAVFLSLIGIGGCVSAGNTGEETSALEGYNRAMFAFNYEVEKKVFRPVAKGYRFVTNEYIRQRVTNFFRNINEPVSAVNHLLQGKLSDTGNNLGRFVMNTTLGVVGLFDVASSAGMERKETGLDETLASWCVPDGPYIVLPILGPSTPRAATGFVADGYASPMYWVAHENGGEDAMLFYYGVAGLKYLNLYAENMKWLESLEEGSVDYYETIKSAYLQNRGQINKCGKSAEVVSSGYDFDMDMEDDYEN